MSKITSATIRTILQVGGAALATSGLLPANCTVTDPALAQYAGMASIVIGTIWSLVNAKRNERLVSAVDNTPTLPSAAAVEKGALDV